jgi:hypothetical protein
MKDHWVSSGPIASVDTARNSANRSFARQFGRVSAPIVPHTVHTMRGPKLATGM